MKILVTRNGQQFGPYSEEEVREYSAAGRLAPNDLAWCEGQPNWVPLSQLVALPAPPPPPLPPVRPASIYAQAAVVAAPVPGAMPGDGAMYNPKAAAYWGLLFSPVLSSFLHARNWRQIGDTEKARANWFWFGGLIIFFCLSPFLPDLPGGNSANTSLGVVIFLSWYYSLGKKQLDYFAAAFPNGYQKKSLVVPVLTACAVFALFVAAVVVVTIAAARKTPAQIAQAMTEEVKPQILKFWRARPKLVNPVINRVTLVPVDGSDINLAGTVDASFDGEKAQFRLVVTRHPKDGTYNWQLLDK